MSFRMRGGRGAVAFVCFLAVAAAVALVGKVVLYQNSPTTSRVGRMWQRAWNAADPAAPVDPAPCGHAKGPVEPGATSGRCVEGHGFRVTGGHWEY